jgi:hypothetical protein
MLRAVLLWTSHLECANRLARPFHSPASDQDFAIPGDANFDRIHPGRADSRKRLAAAIVFFAAVLVPCHVLAQNATEEGKVYLLNTDGSLRELPIEPGTVKSTRSPGMAVVGIGKSKTFTELSGRAAIRIGARVSQTFVFGGCLRPSTRYSRDST